MGPLEKGENECKQTCLMCGGKWGHETFLRMFSSISVFIVRLFCAFSFYIHVDFAT